jgi:hypothetical protein
MGNSQSIKKINFEDMQNAISNKFLIINTLDERKQDCLISNTILSKDEEQIINNYIKKDMRINIVIYGENTQDNKIITKYYQLQKLGFVNIHIYIGGLFEWILLQDIYGSDMFPTTSCDLDILKFKGQSCF